MRAFVPLNKVSPKLKKAIARKKRVLWDVKPVSKRIDSTKRYRRRPKGPAADPEDNA